MRRAHEREWPKGMNVTRVSEPTPDLSELIGIFFDRQETLAEFVPVEVASMPEVARRLLAHHDHMTVTVEAYHGTPVDVDVLQTWVSDTHYAREILLRRQTDGEVVQYGIVRLDRRQLPPAVQAEIVAQKRPLGRILIDHDVMREVECVALWEVIPGARMQELFGVGPDERTYGRTALIHCNGVPAIELLEIVTPS